MDTTITQLLVSLGYGKYVPIAFAAVGFFSLLATVYPPTAPGASTVHKLALLVGNAVPAVPAAPAPDSKKVS